MEKLGKNEHRGFAVVFFRDAWLDVLFLQNLSQTEISDFIFFINVLKETTEY